MLVGRVLGAGLPLLGYVALGAVIDRWVFKRTVGSTPARQTLELLALRVLFPVAVALGVSSIDLAATDWGFVGALTCLHLFLPIPGALLWGCGCDGRDGFVTVTSVALLPSALIIGPPVLLGLYGDAVLSYSMMFILVQTVIGMTSLLVLYEWGSMAAKRDAAAAEAGAAAGDSRAAAEAAQAAAEQPLAERAPRQAVPVQLPIGASVELPGSPAHRAEGERRRSVQDSGTQTLDTSPLENTQPALSAQSSALLSLPCRIAAQRIAFAVLTSPVMVAILIGGFFAAVPTLRPPHSITQHCRPLSGAATALALMCVGSFALSTDRRKDSAVQGLAWLPLVGLLAMRHLVFPLAALGLASIFPGPALGKKVLVVCSSLPLSAACFVFASRYNIRPVHVAGVVAVGTVVCLLPSTLLWVWVAEQVFADTPLPSAAPTSAG
eukprot:TRINITY_DN4950_c0_g1_i2.p1 TRINITY_DN4950_c0_g1~~TRINITY_DN4950_c0_g1_i2.p1  ORF type:complete len:463 (+),score=162.50 TRINITY_DN4950_c0_g1_i2:81-1391(+)